MIPTDPIAHVKTLHASYESRTGYTIRWNGHRERQWSDWCRWADWEWGDAELARVIGYLRTQINAGKRNEGSLKFENLIGQPDRFEEDLNLAKEASKGSRIYRPKPPSQQQPVKDELPPVSEAMDWIKNLKTQS